MPPATNARDAVLALAMILCGLAAVVGVPVFLWQWASPQSNPLELAAIVATVDIGLAIIVLLAVAARRFHRKMKAAVAASDRFDAFLFGTPDLEPSPGPLTLEDVATMRAEGRETFDGIPLSELFAQPRRQPDEPYVRGRGYLVPHPPRVSATGRKPLTGRAGPGPSY